MWYDSTAVPATPCAAMAWMRVSTLEYFGKVDMKNAIILLVLLSLFVSIPACVSSQYMAIGDSTFPPRPRDYVIEVFLPTDAPVNVHKSVAHAKALADLPGNAKEIGRIDTQGAPAATWVGVIEDAKRKARSLGGDAIVIKQWGHHMTSVDGYGRAYYGKNLSMIVVRYNP